jgi:hypothetical protein
MTNTNDPSSPPVGYVRRLGPWDAAMVVVGGVIGSGIFLTPAAVARQTGSATELLLAGRSAAYSRWSARSAMPNSARAAPPPAAATSTCARRSASWSPSSTAGTCWW